LLLAMNNTGARAATTAQELAAVLKDRLWALAKSQDLIAATGGRAPALLALCLQVLEPFDLKRFTLDPGLEEVAVSADMGSGLALLLHELATNALKYGALSAIGGRVTLARGAAPDGRFVLEWRETGGPPVTPPSRRGFGTRLVAAALSAPGGKVAPEFAPEGFRARIEGPTA
jgi:two-component sensor histidine kinase